MRKTALTIWLVSLSMGIFFLFWHVEWVYNLPTPVPVNYKNVLPGNRINIVSSTVGENDRPTLIHFFNPDCPCSKFNMEHFRTLVKIYGDRVNFMVVPVSAKSRTVEEIQHIIKNKLPVLLDTSLAGKCGVYSTPQAVILDADKLLYYRGNYNKSRYCTSNKSNYARLALDSLLLQKRHPIFEPSALTAYGCKIPGILTK